MTTSPMTSFLSLHFEKILARELEKDLGHGSLKSNCFVVQGADQPLSLALLLSQMQLPKIWARPQLVLFASDKEVRDFAACMEFLAPSISLFILPSFDVSPFSSLYPNSRVMQARLRWLHSAQTQPGHCIFAATPEALMQKTIPLSVLQENTRAFALGDVLPDKFSDFLTELGYQSAPLVEDVGSFAKRGGIIDIYSPAHEFPIRIELFGDQIESLRFFNPESQRSEGSLQKFCVIPPREILYTDETRERAVRSFRANVNDRKVEAMDRDQIQHSLLHAQIFPGLDFLLAMFYANPSSPLDFFSQAPLLWLANPLEVSLVGDQVLEVRKKERDKSLAEAICPEVQDLYISFEQLSKMFPSSQLHFSKILVHDSKDFARDEEPSIEISFPTQEFLQSPTEAVQKLIDWRNSGCTVFVAAATHALSQRLEALFFHHDLQSKILADDAVDWGEWAQEQQQNSRLIHIIPRALPNSLRFADENLAFLRDEDFFGEKRRKREYKTKGSLKERTHALAFADLNAGDTVVHALHGIGVFEGLKLMPIGGIDSEFLQLSYKDGDKLYLPVYRIGQIKKYSGSAATAILDKLGGQAWQKTKSRVRNQLRELASELLALYAKRSQIHRTPFAAEDSDFAQFENAFPYDETDDQLKAVSAILKDLYSDKPMDRLVCGDVGFGKTEIAMRAAFKAIHAKKQVAVLVPTTVLAFQHQETFSRRFRDWPVQIRTLNRFVPPAEVRKTVQETKEGRVDILIGTHRILSKDIAFKDLGLLIIDEEQKFGVTHKERIKRFKTNVDCLTLSATPIPRTLNMSLVGMRDLSIINTPPVDRLPTRTFVCKYDTETIRKAILSEIARGGQVFFLHNRVQSIYGIADELRQIVPEARLRVGHGQMEEEELEKTMVAFFAHEIDVLVCTTIIESGIDNPRANTMFIDQAQQFGLSQLYQLRGRVGRSKDRAYCYLLIPQNRRLESDAQERLKVIQENTALGSGFRIAHHDLELRGAGNLLGEDQSGEIDAVGYEMYLELLEEALRTAKGEMLEEVLEPEINVRIPALIPSDYIGDLRIRLSYYKALSEIASPEDIDRIEDELRDQFGVPPDPVINLMGLMLVRHLCRDLGVRDLSSGQKSISLAFTEKTPLSPQQVVGLAQKQPKKFSLTPDSRLMVRIDSIAWPVIYEELRALQQLC